MASSYLYPGVYVEEVSGGARPIESVGTSTAAFIGFTDRRPAENQGEPVLVANWTQYTQSFGGFAYGFYTPLAVYGFFQNGGGACYVQSMLTGDEIAQVKGTDLAGITTKKQAAFKVMSLTARSLKLVVTPGESAGSDAAPAGPPPFSLEVWDANAPSAARLESFANLSLNPADERALLATVNAKSKLIRLLPAADALNLQDVAVKQADTALSETSQALKPLVSRRLATPEIDKTQTPLGDQPIQFNGEATNRTGLLGLAATDDAAIVCAPDIMYAWQQGWMDQQGVISAQKALIAHCESARDRVAILDAPPGKSIQAIKQWREDVANFSSDGGFAALYYPWVRVENQRSGEQILIPPSGHIAGLYARVDTQRGVHKAPANEELRGVAGLEIGVSDSEQGFLNPIGVNCIRAFPGRGIRVWGARTLADSASEWKYVPVRRLFCMVEKSIQRGTQWAVFEPNDLDLWERLKRDIGAYLTNVWRTGALFGVVDQQAFFVKCDEELNPKEVRDAGQVIVQVGIAPVKPAEFVIIRIQQTS